MAKNNTYDADSITVLEGLGGSPEETGNVYRKCIDERIEPSDL